MIELWLKFKDQNASDQQIAVEGERFSVGRHTQCDLCVPDSRLSREHVVIERFGDVFVISDKGSSNGTLLNGEPLTEPKGLQDGDKLDLGGALEVQVALSDANAKDEDETEPPPPPRPPTASVGVPATSSGGGFPTSLLILAPLMAIIVLVFAGGIYYVFSDRSKAVASQTKDDFDYDDDSDYSPPSATPKTVDESAERIAIVTTGQTTAQSGQQSPPDSRSGGSSGSTSSPPTTPGSNQKVEVHAAAFLRRIADNDPKAFVTSEQAGRIAAKIKQLSSSPALPVNLGNAKRNSEKIKEMAAARNLKPQFIAIAAINRLGPNKGDVVQTATGMADVLDKLLAQIGTESADDATLIIAAYEQGAAGETMKMRNMLQELSNKFPESSRAIRTIWFLHKNQKITEAEFDRALTFIAVGTISQNPRDFGVNAEALVF